MKSKLNTFKQNFSDQYFDGLTKNLDNYIKETTKEFMLGINSLDMSINESEKKKWEELSLEFKDILSRIDQIGIKI